MAFRVALLAFCLLSASCAELRSSDGTGGSGGIDPCARVVPEPAEMTESNDAVNAQGVGLGFVCAGACAEEDLSDRWAFATCAGEHRISVSWDNNLDDDLDLALYDSGSTLVGQAATPQSRGAQQVELVEEITAALTDEETYFVEVTAKNTSGNVRNYRLQVSPVD